MSSRSPRSDWHYRQSGVIAHRGRGEALELLLITARKSGRWVIPKGIVEPGLDAALSAAKEAFEEAGVRGKLSDEAVGHFRYRKWGGECQVEVFLLRVDEVLEQWPEAEFRRRQWFAPARAATCVREPDLQAMLRQLPKWVP